MPAYTILFMRKDVTDRRPLTIHIGAKLFWFLTIGAIATPILGFIGSAGWIAPLWLKLNMHSMEQAVEKAEKTLQPLQEQNANLAASKATLEDQLKQAREALALLETKQTMAETARTEATTRLAAAETELITLKTSLATYEKLLKPKLSKELVQCVNLELSLKDNILSYNTSFTKIAKTVKVPNQLTVRARVLMGDNAVTMEQNTTGGMAANHQLEIAKAPSIKGTFTLPPQQVAGSTRLLDVKVYDGNTPVGYCWKTF